MEDLTKVKEVQISRRNTEQKSGSKRWLIILSVAILLISAAFIYRFIERDPHAPAPLVFSACRTGVPGMQRIAADFGTQFNISPTQFSVKVGTEDMPPGKFYTMTLRNSSSNLVVWHDDGIWTDLRSTFPIFSRRIEERSVLSSKERSVGSDRWGYLKSGQRWRYVAFLNHDAIGYRPAPLDEADLMDQVINSACHTSSDNF
jgi:hypothetical protein